jgi:nucleoside diphosphate kinase
MSHICFETDYADLKGKPFFPGLIKYMASGPVIAMVWEGLDAVKTGRVMLGATNPLASAPGAFAAPSMANRARCLRVSIFARHHPW